MRLTAKSEGSYRGAGQMIPVQPTAQAVTIPIPTGGWDAFSPVANMPPENAIEMINFFPQPGYIEPRRGFRRVKTAVESAPIETLMSFQSVISSQNRMFAANSTNIYDTTPLGDNNATPLTVSRPVGSGKIQYVNITTIGGSFLWCCNGTDIPFYWDGTAAEWKTTALTGITNPQDISQVILYRSRIWGILKNSTKAFYLELDSIDGKATTFELGSYFPKGGKVVSCAAWSADVVSGTNEFILFASEFGEVAVFLIEDPSVAAGISYRGTSSFGSPVGGARCFCRIGADTGFITLDGVLPISKVISYDRASEASEALTAKIMNAMSDAARLYGNNFGWQLLDYPKANQIILNVPISEYAIQEQYVMNSITGSWCRFRGQNANCWVVYDNDLYFGDNFGNVCLADSENSDDGQDIECSVKSAYNYLSDQMRAVNKRLTSFRPLVTRDTFSAAEARVSVSPDFLEYGAPDALLVLSSGNAALWDDPASIWDVSRWAGKVSSNFWFTVGEIGYCFSFQMELSLGSTQKTTDKQSLQFNSIDVIFEYGALLG